VLKQVLLHGLFHADPHPANVFVLPGNVICFLDFGNAGRLERPTREALAALVESIVRQDAERLADTSCPSAAPWARSTRTSFGRISPRCSTTTVA